METVSGISFPYGETNQEIKLNKLYFTNETDTTRFCFRISDTDRKCKSVRKLDTATQDVLPELINYKTNPSYYDNRQNNGTTPLLVSIPSSYNKSKLAIMLKTNLDTSNKNLILFKTLGHNNNLEYLRDLLINKLFDEKTSEVSRLSYLQFPIDMSSTHDMQKIIINDSFRAEVFGNNKLNVTVWENDSVENTYTHLFNYSVWVEEEMQKVDESLAPTTSKPQEKRVSLKVSDYKKAFNFNTNDGPEYRKVLAQYENDLPNFKRILASLLDELKALEMYSRKLTSIKGKIVELVGQLSSLHFNSLLRKLNFKADFSRALQALFEPFELNLRFFLKYVCDFKLIAKISQVLSNTNSSKDSSVESELAQEKKHFESNSREYYNWLNKYLSNEKERPELKLLLKRKNFELSKFDYLNKLHLITNNQYFNQLLENFFKFINIPFDDKDHKLLKFDLFKDVKLSQDLLQEDYKIYLAVLSTFNTEKFQLRQMIEACLSNEELTNLIQNSGLMSPSDSDEIVTKDNLDQIFNNPVSSTVTAMPVEDQNSDLSGILYALGGQGKQGWHKEWVVLNQGRLIEYSDWRNGRQPVNKPIDVALANIKPTKHDKRQYCFEILTSSGNKHIFQAMNEDERKKWVKALFNAGQLTDRLVDKKKNLNKIVTQFAPGQPIIPGQSLDRSVSPVSILSKAMSSNLFELVRSAPGSDNHLCADCGTGESVEWVSINFLVCFCINCSSCHRNLGSHISRIKSLKLDNFDNEHGALLKYVNNSEANQYLEQTAGAEKINANCTAEVRLEFIRKKYVSKKYIVEDPNANEHLVRAIQKIEVDNVLKTIVCGADVNMMIHMSAKTASDERPTRKVTLFEYSLRKFVEVDGRKFFIISELLLAHGCRIEDTSELHDDVGLTEEAVEYWKNRTVRLSSKSPI